jgi:hypothetical protein
VVLLVPLSALAQSGTAQVAPFETLLGDFVDDYGILYSVQVSEFLQGSQARYHIVEWDAAGQFLVARNDAGNPAEGGLWTRIDWTILDGTDGFEWAFCYAVYDADSAAAAKRAAATERDTPRSGCNGFPFSRMKRVGQ